MKMWKPLPSAVRSIWRSLLSNKTIQRDVADVLLNEHSFRVEAHQYRVLDILKETTLI